MRSSSGSVSSWSCKHAILMASLSFSSCIVLVSCSSSPCFSLLRATHVASKRSSRSSIIFCSQCSLLRCLGLFDQQWCCCMRMPQSLDNRPCSSSSHPMSPCHRNAVCMLLLTSLEQSHSGGGQTTGGGLWRCWPELIQLLIPCSIAIRMSAGVSRSLSVLRMSFNAVVLAAFIFVLSQHRMWFSVSHIHRSQFGHRPSLLLSQSCARLAVHVCRCWYLMALVRQHGCRRLSTWPMGFHEMLSKVSSIQSGCLRSVRCRGASSPLWKRMNLSSFCVIGMMLWWSCGTGGAGRKAGLSL